MSLTSILKKIEKVNQKQREIEHRYNSTSKECPRQSELERQTEEDQRIFGYSGSQILSLFKDKSRVSAEETRPVTAISHNTRPIDMLRKDKPMSKYERRTKSMSKPVVHYREQYYFLFKEDIFNETYDKSRVPYFVSSTKKEQQKLVKCFKKQESSVRVKNLFKKSVQEQKKQFIRCFDSNLSTMRLEKERPVTKITKNRMTYQKRVEKAKEIQPKTTDVEDLFKLTRTQVSPSIKKLKLSFGNFASNIKEANIFLNYPEENKLNITPPTKESVPFNELYDELLALLPKKVVLIAIAVPSLLSLKMKLTIIDEEIIIEQTKEKLDLKLLGTLLLQQQNFIQLYFQADSAVLYNMFIMDHSMLHYKHIEHEITLFKYYLKRFLLFDNSSSIQAVNESTDLILKSNVDVPDEFLSFVKDLDKRSVHFYDKQHRYYTLDLKKIVLSGFKAVQAYKHEMGYGQKVIKLKHGTRREIKQQMCNWAYFYICFLTITMKNISIGGSYSSSTFCSAPSSQVVVCFPAPRSS